MGMKSTAIVLLCLISFQVSTGTIVDNGFGGYGGHSLEISAQNDSTESAEFLDGSTSSLLFLRPQCSIGEYLHGLRCRPCSACAPDFYARRYCQPTTDAVCEWCSSLNPLRNMDFWLKCQRAVKVNAGVSFFDAVPEDARVQVPESPYVLTQSPVSTSVVRIPVQLQESAKLSWKVELILESSLYLAVIALLFVAFRLATRSKPYYRNVAITAPVFDESDKSNIRLAAATIAYLQKRGQRRYDDLEEFV